ncbi:MAG: sel1 repeat family protein [Deltaproteobacteria bacterium]|nr:sel1 repeat family protein [Deltaproteobacteria bacterium]
MHKENMVKGLKHIHRAAELGHPEANNLLRSYIQQIVESEDSNLEDLDEPEETRQCSEYEPTRGYHGFERCQVEKIPGIDELVEIWETALFNHDIPEENPGFEYLNKVKWPVKLKEFIDHLSQALELGLDLAGLVLADLYKGKFGLKKNLETAASYFEKAAELGNPYIQRLVGNIFHLGNEVEKDDKKAIFWLEKAVKQGNLDAQNDLGVLYIKADDEIKDSVKCGSCLTKAAEKGHAEAQFNIGVLYAYGLVFPRKNFVNSESWWTEAAKLEFLNAQHNLGLLYYQGEEGVPRDLEKSFYWWTMAAKGGFVESQCVLALQYGLGLDRPIDLEKSQRWWQKAAEQALSEYQFNQMKSLAGNDENGINIVKTHSLWLEFYKKKSHIDFNYNIGTFDEDGPLKNDDKLILSPWLPSYEYRISTKKKILTILLLPINLVILVLKIVLIALVLVIRVVFSLVNGVKKLITRAINFFKRDKS